MGGAGLAKLLICRLNSARAYRVFDGNGVFDIHRTLRRTENETRPCRRVFF